MNKNKEKRFSVGIACVRTNSKKQLEILLVQKRFSYAYSQFVFGDWGPIRKEGLQSCIQQLLNGMTIEEKTHILSLDFDKIWYRIWLREYKPKSYFIVRAKFEKYFLADEGVALKKWLAEAEHGGEVWEIPKGRRNRGESEINAAVREFEEETQIPKDLYDVLFGLKVRDSVTDEGITYISTYHIALANKQFEPKISVCNNQINEIINIRWCTKNDIEVLKRPILLLNVRRIFKIVKKYLKGMFRPAILPVSIEENAIDNTPNLKDNNRKNKSIFNNNTLRPPPGFEGKFLSFLSTDNNDLNFKKINNREEDGTCNPENTDVPRQN